MFDLFSDAAKAAAQMEILSSEYGFALWETLYSLALEVLFAYVIGLPLGVLLVTGERDGIRPLPRWLMAVLNGIINLLRSVPFLILMIIALPLSKIIVGINNPLSLREEVFIKLVRRCDPIFSAHNYSRAIQEIKAQLIDVLRHIIQEGASGACVGHQNDLAGFLHRLNNLGIIQRNQGVEVDDFRADTVFFLKNIGSLDSTIQR